MLTHRDCSFLDRYVDWSNRKHRLARRTVRDRAAILLMSIIGFSPRNIAYALGTWRIAELIEPDAHLHHERPYQAKGIVRILQAEQARIDYRSRLHVPDVSMPWPRRGFLKPGERFDLGELLYPYDPGVYGFGPLRNQDINSRASAVELVDQLLELGGTFDGRA